MNIEIRNTIIDRSKQRSIDDRLWGKALEAQRVSTDTDLPSELIDANVAIERYALSNQPFRTVIGGLCSIFTGDMKEPQTAIDKIRADQITEAVGLIPGKPALIVIEDSLFAQMFPSLGVESFKRQGSLFETYFNNWARINQVTKVNYVYTSQIEEALLETSRELSRLISDTNFMTLSSAPVLVMYTNLWSQLLTKLDFLDSDNVLCFEPAPHFAPNKNLTTIDQRRAFENYLRYLKDNPYGKQGENKNFSIAGYTPALDNNRNRLRLNPIETVITDQNYSQKIAMLKSQLNQPDYSPFPLVSNATLGVAFNWLLFSKEAKTLVSQLMKIQSEYYIERKKNTVSPESKKALKPAFAKKTNPLESQILDIAQNTLTQIFNKGGFKL